jgi:diguanylate cyclase (GGDEF)-like protein/PAS domain S-box-containing protein
VLDADDADMLREVVRALERSPSLFSLSRDAVVLYAPDGAMVVGNDASRALIGEEFSGFHSGQHIAAGELDRAQAYLSVALSGQSVDFEAVLIGRDGKVINVIARLIPALFDAKIVGVFGIAHDITLQRRAEASREQFRSLFEQHPDPISMVDASGRYARLNAAAEHLLGYSSEEVEGRKVGEVAPLGETPDKLASCVLNILRSGKPTRYERTFARKDGTPTSIEGTAVPIIVNEQVTGVFLLSRDITHRERLQEALALLISRGRVLHRLAFKMGADPDAQASSALAFGLKELGFESAFIVAIHGKALAIKRRVGRKATVGARDPLFRRLFRNTIAGSALFEVDDAALEQRWVQAGGTSAFCRSFIGVPLDVHGGRYGALGFASRSATTPLTDFDREFLRSSAELVSAGIERAIENKRLQNLAHHDALTGLPNRLLLSDRFRQAIAIAQRRGEQVAVYFIDIDKFKVINDTQGHLVGDAVLRTVARRLLKACRASDTVARLGGDEFIVLHSGPSSETQSLALAARLRSELEAPCDIEGVPLRLSVSIGISIFPQDGEDQRTLLESADTALYAAKGAGAGSIRPSQCRDAAKHQ